MNARCSHLTVEYKTQPSDIYPSVITGHWECTECGHHFSPDLANPTLKHVLDTLYCNVDALGEILSTVEPEITAIATKPLKEMGISEKVKLAKLFLAIKQLD